MGINEKGHDLEVSITGANGLPAAKVEFYWVESIELRLGNGSRPEERGRQTSEKRLCLLTASDLYKHRL